MEYSQVVLDGTLCLGRLRCLAGAGQSSIGAPAGAARPKCGSAFFCSSVPKAGRSSEKQSLALDGYSGAFGAPATDNDNDKWNDISNEVDSNNLIFGIIQRRAHRLGLGRDECLLSGSIRRKPVVSTRLLLSDAPWRRCWTEYTCQ